MLLASVYPWAVGFVHPVAVSFKLIQQKLNWNLHFASPGCTSDELSAGLKRLNWVLKLRNYDNSRHASESSAYDGQKRVTRMTSWCRITDSLATACASQCLSLYIELSWLLLAMPLNCEAGCPRCSSCQSS